MGCFPGGVDDEGDSGAMVTMMIVDGSCGREEGERNEMGKKQLVKRNKKVL